MNEDALVSCIDCINYDTLQKIQTFLGCTSLCKKCLCCGCDCNEPESERRFQDRHKFEYGTTVGYLNY